MSQKVKVYKQVLFRNASNTPRTLHTKNGEKVLPAKCPGIIVEMTQVEIDNANYPGVTSHEPTEGVPVARPASAAPQVAPAPPARTETPTGPTDGATGAATDAPEEPETVVIGAEELAEADVAAIEKLIKQVKDSDISFVDFKEEARKYLDPIPSRKADILEALSELLK